MGKKESVPNRRYTEEFKTEAVRLALSTSGNAAAKRLGIPQSTMTNWVRQSREGATAPVAGVAVAVKRPVSELEAENARLRRELASAKLDLEIVKNFSRCRAPAQEVETPVSATLRRSKRAAVSFLVVQPR
jgi:transposase